MAQPASALIEVVIPVYNECSSLAQSVTRLHRFLSNNMPYRWRITIADNASTDGTLFIARELAHQYEHVGVIHLDRKGRGRALRAAWSASEADVVCYMDVDLSTALEALLPLVSPLLSGHSDVAIGSRLARGANVTRGPKREFISRSYNAVLKVALGAKFSDAQCGFKAIRRDVAAELLPNIEDKGWFFDTELLVLAQRRKLRIHEVPVDWVDDPDSRVDIVKTAVEDLKGVARLRMATPITRFIAVGICSTIAYALLYALLWTPLGSGGANALALAITAVANTQANRRFTFGIAGRMGLARQHAAGAAVFTIALALTAAALDVLHSLDPRPATILEVAVLITASAFATITRYVALKTWVFARASQRRSSECRQRPRLVQGRARLPT
ncbi:MAG: bifunctional glycosyltransferase family 2/GtrA family protein [Solirubrobacteraceae bacterium]